MAAPTPDLYLDNQDTFNPDIDQLFALFIATIDQARSHYNALNPGLTQTATPQYQESRCHAFFRMLGLPVVSKSPVGYHSPGYDPTLNLDSDSLKANQTIDANALKNSDFIKSQTIRETQEATVYNDVFSVGGLNAIAVSMGSIHLRSFATQLTSSIDPLDFDSGQQQVVNDRITDITNFFSVSAPTFPSQINNINLSLLNTTHIIKPFVVDPRIDNAVMPNANRIAAPFLLDRSKLKIFDGQSGASVVLQRPYIEFVLSTIFNNSSKIQLNDQQFVTDTLDSIKSTGTTDQDLLNIVSNPNLTQASLVVFSKYLKIIRSLVTLLVTSIIQVEAIRGQFNWQPLPNPNGGGLENGAYGASVAAPLPNDPNNLRLDNDLITNQVKQIVDQFALNVGINGVPDPGDFAFSGVDDLVFNGAQTAQTSYADIAATLISKRNQIGNAGLNALKNIEIIMGEFSGLGLLDIVAIQCAMWIINPADLASMIDQAAFNRMKSRTDLSVTVSQSGDIMSALTSFEAAVTQMYKIIDGYIKILTTNGYYTDIQPS